MPKKDDLKSSDLTMYFIYKPLRAIMEKLEINENTIMASFKTIIENPEAKDADKIKCIEMFLKLMGPIASNQRIDLTVNTALRDAVEEIEGTIASKKK